MKGQTAVEYLMTYGWAILIILIVAGVLAYYGIFQPQGFLGPTARGFGQIQVLNPWSFASDGTITLNVQNQVGGTITPKNIAVNFTNGGSGGSGAGNCDLTSADIPSGQQGVIKCQITSGLSGLTTSKPYTAPITITYTYNSNDFTSTGTLSGTVG